MADRVPFYSGCSAASALSEHEEVVPWIAQSGVGATGQVERLALEAHALGRQLLVGRTNIGHSQDDAGVLADCGLPGFLLVAGVGGERDRRSRGRDLDVAALAP